jgi:uncharacterized membrane protein YcaP (DUF421 family)
VLKEGSLFVNFMLYSAVKICHFLFPVIRLIVLNRYTAYISILNGYLRGFKWFVPVLSSFPWETITKFAV